MITKKLNVRIDGKTSVQSHRFSIRIDSVMTYLYSGSGGGLNYIFQMDFRITPLNPFWSDFTLYVISWQICISQILISPFIIL